MCLMRRALQPKEPALRFIVIAKHVLASPAGVSRLVKTYARFNSLFSYICVYLRSYPSSTNFAQSRNKFRFFDFGAFSTPVLTLLS